MATRTRTAEPLPRFKLEVQTDARIIHAIALRAVRMAAAAGWVYDPLDAEMDITACHCNGCPLDLAKLLGADDFNFAHDVFGIRRKLDRENGLLRDCFFPRAAQKGRRS